MRKQDSKVVALISTCKECDDYKKLQINGDEVLDGDYYHDKISERIEGFISGMKYCGYEVKITKDKYVCFNCKQEQQQQ